MKKYPWLTAIVLICSLLLSGCGEVYNEYYLSNHMNHNLTVTLTPFYFENSDLSYGPLIKDIRTSERAALTQPIDHHQVEDSLQFVLPPQSSVYLGFSTGGNQLFSQLEVSSESLQVAMDQYTYRDYFEVYDRLVGAVVQVYNVK